MAVIPQMIGVVEVVAEAAVAGVDLEVAEGVETVAEVVTEEAEVDLVEVAVATEAEGVETVVAVVTVEEVEAASKLTTIESGSARKKK